MKTSTRNLDISQPVRFKPETPPLQDPPASGIPSQRSRCERQELSAPIAAFTRCLGPCRCPCAFTAATSRAEIEAAFGILRDDAPWIHREGVLWHKPSQTQLLFVTLTKSEALFSPSTRYRDLALGPSLFPRPLRALARIHTVPCHVS